MTSGVEDELLETPDPPRWPLAVAVLVAVGVLVVVLAHATRATMPPPTRAAAPTHTASLRPPAVSALRTPNCPEADDGQSVCATSNRVPAAFVRAVAALFPGARPETARTDLIRQSAYSPPDPLWYRRFTARGDDFEILIEIRQAQPGDRNAFTTDASIYASTSRLTLIRARHWAVRIAVVAIGVPAPSSRELLALAGDERLVAA